MHPADIKASLVKAGRRQFQLARELKVTQPAVHLVIQGQTKSARIATAISKVTGLPIKDLWPGKYPDLEKHQAIEANVARKQAAAAAGAGARPSTTSTTPTKKAA
jgi:lambda repressor-like predicted transcriptional regulator